MKEKIILVGAGGHAKSVIDCIDSGKFEVVGFIDDNKKGAHCGFPVIGNKLEDIVEYQKYKYFVTIGDIAPRKRWYEKLKKHNLKTVNIIDKTAIISPSAKIGSGNFIGKFAIINADSVIGDDNVINTRALIEHECVVGSHTHLSTNSVINGNVIINDCVFLGSCAVCIGQLTIGESTTIGAGSVVIKDVEANVTVVGVPAKVILRG